jgi:predicted oxidoreductase
LRQEGKVLQFGVSNFLPHQLDLLQSYVDVPLVTNQIEASVLCHEHFDNGNIDHLHKLKIRPQIWSPLAGGRVFSEMSEQAIRVRGILQNLAEKYSASIEQVAMAWLLSHPLKFQLIIGSGKIDRIRDSLASQSIDLTRDEWFKIWTAYTGHDIP